MSPMTRRHAPVALALALGLLASPAFADPLHGRSWDYNVRNSQTATGKAAMMWQAERADAAAGGASGGGAGSGVPSAGAGSTANNSIITIIIDNGATGNITIGTDQESEGNQSSEVITVTETGETTIVGAGAGE